MSTKYTPGTLTAVLLHGPIGVTYIAPLRVPEPIDRGAWLKSLGVLAGFLALGVAAPNVLLADKNSPHSFTTDQMGPYKPDTAESE